ncbi:L,D-transpeptidase [Patulibacter sp. SYSU D01012]|uniref:L,D-transpeptidase n=1 Tax=Patulibacter sp. SYSU D01012 TaxID=2817381 RepID=UPI001B304AB7|nr:L,D-transpeptidase [Patulibacter sp. SYSU D01012]
MIRRALSTGAGRGPHPRAAAAAALAVAALAAVPPSAASAADGGGAAETQALRAALAAPGTPGAAIRVRRPGASGAFVAKLLEPAVARARPGGRAVWRAGVRTRYAGQATRLTIDGARYDDRGRAWVRVLLPVRPNGTRGWLPAASVRAERSPWAVRVRLGARELRVLRDGRLVRRARVVVGAPATPTPRGTFAVYETTHQRDPGGFIGPGALHLTAYSNVLDDYGGGPGVVAIHGRGPAALGDPLGSARSHGCVRVDNRTLRWLRARLGPGTVVRISR